VQARTPSFEAAAMLDPRLDVVRHNILRSGRAGRSFAWRRVTVCLAVLAALAAVSDPASGLVLVVLALGSEAIRALEVRGLRPATAALLRDDRRARRWKPQRWDWGWLTITLPFSATRTWRRYRRRHPGPGSWRPPA
jgi:hypothetical protein